MINIQLGGRKGSKVAGYAIVDNEDADLGRLRWCLSHGRAKRTLGKHGEKSELIHRVIVQRMMGRDLVKSEVVDHINGNPLDNRRKNLRAVTQEQNLQNRHGATRVNCSGIRGVVWHSRAKKWAAQVSSRGKHYHLGLFTDKIEAGIIASAKRKSLGFLESSV